CVGGFFLQRDGDTFAGFGAAPDASLYALLKHHVVADNRRQLHLSVHGTYKHEHDDQSDKVCCMTGHKWGFSTKSAADSSSFLCVTLRSSAYSALKRRFLTQSTPRAAELRRVLSEVVIEDEATDLDRAAAAAGGLDQEGANHRALLVA